MGLGLGLWLGLGVAGGGGVSLFFAFSNRYFENVARDLEYCPLGAAATARYFRYVTFLLLLRNTAKENFCSQQRDREPKVIFSKGKLPLFPSFFVFGDKNSTKGWQREWKGGRRGDGVGVGFFIFYT